MRNRSLAFALSLVAVAAFAVGCGADKKDTRAPLWLPAAGSFKAGTCRNAAEAVLALGEFAYRHQDAKRLSDADREQLRVNSDKLDTAGKGAESAVAGKVDSVQAAVGFMRLRTGKSYDPALLRDMENARVALQTLCVSG
jgi:hypothetical protein